MSRKSIALLFLNIFTIIINSLAEETDLRVCIPNLGCLQGTYLFGFQIEKFEAFMGIPYAKPPVGKLRLQNPKPFGSWENVMQATKPKPSCLQKNYFLETHPIMGVEDCLYLNLYRPVQRSTKLLPIIFYIHGGGFSFGSPHPDMLGPAYFMDTQEVILITFAYRLGPFGFLSTGDEYMPGNFGLKDQNLALKWVFDNAVYFSGDSNSITIFGHSIGGSSVQFHMLSPASQVT
ncbi:venom carboxylesterase-6-like [Teleopsis dalmanni]|uniref:venom carboxylesterase-6-like n=1 Tax=Teleopsis dalmanni TaxID=139649 RepID=UPI0018CFEC29|nr:venom carboxylesterase-6-like [Teleopsis dalmanni]